jgi:hypothetical protein
MAKLPYSSEAHIGFEQVYIIPSAEIKRIHGGATDAIPIPLYKSRCMKEPTELCHGLQCHWLRKGQINKFPAEDVEVLCLYQEVELKADEVR